MTNRILLEETFHSPGEIIFQFQNLIKVLIVTWIK